jgi:hypothetical protein
MAASEGMEQNQEAARAAFFVGEPVAPSFASFARLWHEKLGQRRSQMAEGSAAPFAKSMIRMMGFDLRLARSLKTQNS